jgi:hypothetical protein
MHRLLANSRQMSTLEHEKASMIYFDFDMSKSTNTVVYFDWKTVIYIYLRKMSHTIYAANGKVTVTFSWRMCYNRYQNRNKSWKPECVLNFNMDWRILVNFIPRLWLGIKY